MDSGIRGAVNNLVDTMSGVLFYPHTSHNFYLVMGPYITSFKKISGLVIKDNPIIPFKEGGLNDRVHMLKDVQKSFKQMTLEKGSGILNLAGFPGSSMFMMLIVLSHERKVKRVIKFGNTEVIEVKVSDYDATTSQCSIDTITIAYDSAMEIPLAGIALEPVNNLFLAGRDTVLEDTTEDRNKALDKIKEHNKQAKEEKEKVAKAEEEKIDDEDLEELKKIELDLDNSIADIED